MKTIIFLFSLFVVVNSMDASPAQCLLDRIQENKTLLNSNGIIFSVNKDATLVTIGYGVTGNALIKQGSYYSNPFGSRIYERTDIGRTVLSWPSYCGCSTYTETVDGPGLNIKMSGICGKF